MLSDALCSALPAGVLFLVWPRKSSQKEGHPWVGARLRRVPCATRNAGRLRNSGLRPSDSARRLPPAILRCSAPPKGPGKTSMLDWWSSIFATSGGRPQQVFGGEKWLCPDALWAPLRGAEQRRRGGASRLALSEPKASLASRPPCRVAQGTGRSPAPTQGSPFLWLLSFGEAKESTPAGKAEQSA